MFSWVDELIREKKHTWLTPRPVSLMGLREMATYVCNGHLAMSWRMYDNSGNVGMRLIAAGRQATVTQIGEAAIWQYLIQEYGDVD